MPSTTVAIYGATGETGRSIVDGLLESFTEFTITALSRPSSIDKPGNQKLRERGITVVACDVHGPLDNLVQLLKDMDVVICSLSYLGIEDQRPLAKASKQAGVKRFVPSAYAPITAPKGSVDFRDQKEDIFNYIKELQLPYTIIDVGGWYQGLIPKLPSGKTDYAMFPSPFGANPIFGEGNVPSAAVDLRDVGRYVARIIADPRTLNRMVLAATETMTGLEVSDVVEQVTGEKVERQQINGAALSVMIAEAEKVAKSEGAGPFDLLKLYMAQYQYSIGVKGENSPKYADYLGYLSAKELYPDFEGILFKEFLQDVLDGKI